jgi:hypothetical protein
VEFPFHTHPRHANWTPVSGSSAARPRQPTWRTAGLLPSSTRPRGSDATPPPKRLTIIHNPCQGEDRKCLNNIIRVTHHAQNDHLLIYCRGTGPNPTQTCLMWTGAAVAFKRGRELNSKATTVGTEASHRDTAFHALADTAKLAKNILDTNPSNSVTIYMADHQVILWCLTTDKHDNALTCRTIRETLSTILFNHPNTNISIRWIPGTASFHPLKRLLEVATAAAAAVNPSDPQPPPTIAALKSAAKSCALQEWERVWLTDPRRNPAYRALHHPPSGQPPEFISGIKSFARPVFCTAIHLLTEHAFTGKYNARHRP